jgi:MFS family permease
LIFGRVGDVFGYKPLVIIGFVWFSIWSLVSGLAIYSNKVLFIFARALAGIGPSISLPNAHAMLGYATSRGSRSNSLMVSSPRSHQPGSFSVLPCQFVRISLVALGIFASAIVLAAVAAIAGIVLPDCPKGKDTYLVQGVKNSLHHYIVQLDLLGSVTGVLGLVLFNFA